MAAEYRLLAAGTLQSAWGQDLAAFNQVNLSDTGIQGQLPAAWAQAMPNLQLLDLSANLNLTSSIPAEWTSSNAFPSLEILKLGSCNLTGPLPGQTPCSAVLPSDFFVHEQS